MISKPIQDEIWIRTIAQKNGLSITDIQFQRLGAYVELLKRWNQSVNLISRKDVDRIWSNHILLSIAFLFKIDFASGCRVLDLGTGGGLPGIPLSILRPDVSFVLLDSINKKIKAVEDIVQSLQLQNASVVCSRAEDINTRRGYANSFDAVIARAVAGLEDLVKWGMPFLRVTGSANMISFKQGKETVSFAQALVALKGGDLTAEMEKTARRYPGIKFRSTDLVLNGNDVLQNSERKFILVENYHR